MFPKFLIPLSSLSGLLPIVFFLLFLRRNRRLILWVIFLYVLISLITDQVSLGLNSLKSRFYISSVFTIIEYSLFALFFYLNLKSAWLKRFLLAGTVVFMAFAFLSLFKDTAYNFDSLAASIESTLIISYCILLFYEQLTSLENTFIYSFKEFWITIAILIYLATTLFLFISSFYISEEQRLGYWVINNTANIIKNILISVAFVLNPESPKQATFQKRFNA